MPSRASLQVIRVRLLLYHRYLKRVSDVNRPTPDVGRAGRSLRTGWNRPVPQAQRLLLRRSGCRSRLRTGRRKMFHSRGTGWECSTRRTAASAIGTGAMTDPAFPVPPSAHRPWVALSGTPNATDRMQPKGGAWMRLPCSALFPDRPGPTNSFDPASESRWMNHHGKQKIV